MTDEQNAKELQDEEARLRQRARLVADRRRLARWGEDRPGLTDARQPEQPPRGPGGKEYEHASVRSSVHGEGALAYWLFTPAQPMPPEAPLVVFLHGWGGNRPAASGAWIDHLVKRGNVVVFPVYQDLALSTPPDTMLANAVTATKDAIRRLKESGPVRADLARVALFGHSLGGTLAAQMAAVAAREGLPTPRAVMPVAAGQGTPGRQRGTVADFREIPPGVLLLVITCEDDKVAGDTVGKVIFSGVPQIPTVNKNLVVMRSDYHGTPPLVANHRSPGAANPAYWAPRERVRMLRARRPPTPADLPPVDAMDYYGYWKFGDGLIGAAFHGKSRVYALGDTPQQRFMGVWSDGTPVAEPRVLTDPRMLW